MKALRLCCLLVSLVFTLTALGANAGAPRPKPSEPAATLASTVDRDITSVETLLIDTAEAMPEAKFNFTPENLNLSGSDYRGVRSFALQVRHVAASNYAIWAPLTGDTFPDDYKGGDGPANLKSKAEIIRFLKDSFALGHKAAATLTAQNMLQSAGGGNSTRLHLATFAIAHAYDHYGQMVEYLRMSGIVPPASRPKSN